MLKLFRHKNVAKIVLWGLLILILPAFVLWGTGAGGGSKDKGPKFVGLIDGKKISFGDFAESIAAIRCQIILNYFNQPKVMDTFLKSNAFLGKLAWDRLIMAKEARKAKMKVSNAEVINFIRSQPLFLRGGYFDDRMYGYILRNNMALEPRMFEEMMRGNLEIQKFNDRLTKDIKVTDQEIAESYGKINDKLKISYIDFPAAPAAGEGYSKLKDLMAKEKLSFEAAAAKLALNVKESAFFSKGETIEGIGEVGPLIETASTLKPDEVSTPIEMEKGAIIFRVSGREKFDEEKFKKEKDGYSKKLIELKKTRYIENWLRGLEKASTVNIDFKDYDKYYR
ncbi:MAG: peptidylprolyl isomerase [Candidatus Omnitrophica bacterium]|nr:peptidylprolyl isomerase [Candidatus Omnitrophota bacterium]